MYVQFRDTQWRQALLLVFFVIGIFDPIESMKPERPYYIRKRPASLLAQPMDVTLSSGHSINLTCEVMGMEPIISGWWPHIFWRHNSSTINSTWPGNVTIHTNYWNMTTLHTSFPGTYQCIVDDGSFILASRLATVKEGECVTPQQNSNFCMVCGGHGAPTYSWYKDGIPLNNSTYLLEEEGRIVTVTNETRDPSGLYTCIASGVIRQWYLPPQASRDTTTVLIDGNPNDVFVSHSGYGVTVEDITLHCNITVPGSAVNISWFHNGEQNHSLSADTVHFPRNSNVSAIAGTYVCASSTSNWEARVQFRILLKQKPNPPDTVKSSCIMQYKEINAQNLGLSWTPPLWNDLVDGIDIWDSESSLQVLAISRHNHTGELYHHRLATKLDSKAPLTLRLDSEYCITLVSVRRTPLQPYYMSEGNSTLHHCNANGHSCLQTQLKSIGVPVLPSSDDVLSINCGELQSDDTFDCTFMWQHSTNDGPYQVTPYFNVMCPDGSSQWKNTTKSYKDLDRVIISTVNFPAFACDRECHADVFISVKSSGVVKTAYSRSGNFMPQSHKLAKPTINCTRYNGESRINIMIPQDDRIRLCWQSDTNNNNNNQTITVTLFVNEVQFIYSALLNETLEIPAFAFNNESKAKGNITVVAMYSIAATGTSMNSTEINIPAECSCVSGWSGDQCDEAQCSHTCMNGGICFQPDTCSCAKGWRGSTCSEADATNDIAGDVAAVAAAAGLLLLIIIFLVTGLCSLYICRRNPAIEPPLHLVPDYYLEMVSDAECDVATVCDDVLEDPEMWIEDLSQGGEPAILKTSNDVHFGYIEGVARVPTNNSIP